MVFTAPSRLRAYPVWRLIIIAYMVRHVVRALSKEVSMVVRSLVVIVVGTGAAHSKQKKASERWMKLQRHKSFDSTVPITEPMDFDPSAFVGGTSMNSSRLTPDQLLQEYVGIVC